MKRLIIYDLDGTLVDTKEDIAHAVNQMLGEFSAPLLSVEEVASHVGKGLRQLIEDCLKTHDPEQIERGMQIYRTYYRAHLLDNTGLYPGARQVLDYFKERKQAVITNKPNPYSKEILQALGVNSYFVEIIAGDSIYGRKPDPASVKMLLAREGVSREDALLVGDSPIDVETGRNAGVFTVGVAQGFSSEEELISAGPDEMVDSLMEFLELAKKRGW